MGQPSRRGRSLFGTAAVANTKLAARIRGSHSWSGPEVRVKAGPKAWRWLLLALTACGRIDADTGTELAMDTIGDTIVARPAGIGAWGEAEVGVESDLLIGALDGDEEYTFGSIGGIALASDGSVYVIDEQVPVVRRYDTAGSHLGSFGRRGGGPGEMKQPNGVAVLEDGRVIVRDPGNARMNVYSPAGEPLTTWQIPGGFFTSDPIHVDTAGYIYIDVIADRRADGTWRLGLLKMDATGASLDTLRQPFPDHQAAILKAERVTKDGSTRSFTTVPFTPSVQWAWSPLGHYVGGVNDRYAIDAFRPDGKVFRIERAYEPVPVQAGEKDTEVQRITRNMRSVDSDWKWQGPQPPDHKPPFRDVFADAEGRVWVRLHAEATRLPPDPDAPKDPRGLPPLDRWTEPLLFDVFLADGHYLGRVRLPDRFTMHTAQGERVCGVQRDELGVEYVACYRLRVGAKESD